MFYTGEGSINLFINVTFLFEMFEFLTTNPLKWLQKYILTLIRVDKNTLDNEDSILSSPVFYNKEIKVGNTPVWKTNWYKIGIMYINDLIAENGEFLSQENLKDCSIQKQISLNFKD